MHISMHINFLVSIKHIYAQLFKEKHQQIIYKYTYVGTQICTKRNSVTKLCAQNNAIIHASGVSGSFNL